MKKRVLRVMSVLLAGVMTIGATACGSSKADNTGVESTQAATDSQSADNEELYNATMIYLTRLDPTEEETQQLNDAMNAITIPAINTQVTLIPMTIGAYISQAQLLLSGGEEYDVVPMMADFATTFVEGEYVEDLSQYTDKLRNLATAVGEDCMTACSIGDYVWGIPTQKEQVGPYGYIMRADICDELGIDVDTIKTHADMTAVFEKVHEAYPDMTCFGGFHENNPIYRCGDFDYLGDRLGVLMDHGQSTEVVNFFETDECMESAKQMREWYNAGYVSKDFATSTDYGDALLGAGNLFSYAIACKPDTDKEVYASVGTDVKVAIVEPGVKSTSTIANFGYGIASSSDDPERAAELLNLVYTSPEISDLLIWGIEGQDWAENDEGYADYPVGVTAETVPFHNAVGWAQPNQFLAHVWVGNDADIWSEYKDFNESGYTSVALGFSPDLSAYADQVSACTAVLNEYVFAIGSGFVDPEQGLKEMNDKLYAAGLQDIIDAKQEQLDQWLANK